MLPQNPSPGCSSLLILFGFKLISELGYISFTSPRLPCGVLALLEWNKVFVVCVVIFIDNEDHAKVI